MDLLLWVEDAANIFAYSTDIGVRAAALLQFEEFTSTTSGRA
jgi:hypothetical protein